MRYIFTWPLIIAASLVLRWRGTIGRIPLFILMGFLLMTSSAHSRVAGESFADLAQKLLPSVVNISTTSVIKDPSVSPQIPQFPPGSPFEEFFRDFLERNRPQEQRRSTSLGSGFIIEKSGVVITNNHVIQDAQEIKIILQDNTTLTAKLIGRDPKTDIAVLKVNSEKDLPSVSFGDSDQLRVGDWVVAIGNPFGLGGSVTAGIVSARGRNIGSGPYDDFIQTDASINRGNSGGPLFNMRGEVVGINSNILSPTGGSVGLGFSIPSSTAKGVIDQLRRYGRTRRGWLGVRIQQVTNEIGESLGLKKTSGALVAEVTAGSPAEKGKIQKGDVILSFNDQMVNEMRNLPLIVASTKIGQKVPIVVWRKGKKKSLSVAVGELDEKQALLIEPGQQKDTKSTKESKLPSLGLTLAFINDAVRKQFKLKKSSRGAVITLVDPGGTAAEQGLKKGDIIIEAGQTAINSLRDVKDKIEKARREGRKSILLLMERQSGIGFIAIRIGQG